MTDNPVYAKPASQVDLERRLANGNASDRVLSTADFVSPVEPDDEGRDYLVEGNQVENYIGTDAMYQNYANDSEAPIVDDESSPEEQVATKFVDSLSPTETTPKTVDPVDESDESESSVDPDAVPTKVTQTS